MAQSMTGFATDSTTIQLPNGQMVGVTCILKTVNAKLFEFTSRMPHSFLILEPEITRYCRTQLIRGNTYCTLTVSNPALLRVPATPSITAARAYLTAAEELTKQLNITGNLTLADLVQLPGIFEIIDQTIDTNLREKLLSFAQTVIQKLVEDRTREGILLLQDIQERITRIITEFAALETRAQQAYTTRKQALDSKITELSSKPENSSIIAGLEHELSRTAVHEELSRFKLHAEQVHTILKSSELEIGRRLDFTAQEMLREINTTAAKCADAEMSGLVITIKVELEKIREQAQNLV